MEPNLKTKLVLILFPFFILLTAFITHRYSNLYLKIFGFEAYGEWIQFILYSMASVMGVVTWSALKKNIWRKERLIIALFSIGCFFISLEELSYGQKIFNWQTPSLFIEYNLQQETNLHNSKGLPLHLFFMAVGFYGGFAWVYKHISRGGYLPI
jgi:hypothetical protein